MRECERKSNKITDNDKESEIKESNCLGRIHACMYGTQKREPKTGGFL